MKPEKRKSTTTNFIYNPDIEHTVEKVDVGFLDPSSTFYLMKAGLLYKVIHCYGSFPDDDITQPPRDYVDTICFKTGQSVRFEPEISVYPVDIMIVVGI